MATSETYKTRVISSNRVSIPEEVMKILKLEKGQIVKVTIKLVKL